MSNGNPSAEYEQTAAPSETTVPKQKFLDRLGSTFLDLCDNLVDNWHVLLLALLMGGFYAAGMWADIHQLKVAANLYDAAKLLLGVFAGTIGPAKLRRTRS